MWQRISQRLTDPVFYRKRGRQILRHLGPRAESAVPVDAERFFESGIAGGLAVIIAHPDDEIFVSGLICEAVSRRIEVGIVCLTRGEGGETGGFEREELGRKREAELRASAAALGVSSVIFLNHIDPVGKPFRTYAPDVSPEELACQIHGILTSRLDGIGAVVTHGSSGEYWHPAHLLVHRAVRLAVRDLSVILLTMNAWQRDHPLPEFINRDDPAHLFIDGMGFYQWRLKALESHASQLAFFASHGGGSHEVFLDRMAREAYRIN